MSTTTANDGTNNDAAIDLPPSDSPTLGLVHPTPEEKLQQWHENHTSWGGPLSLDVYISREMHLASQDLTKDSGMTYWALVDTAAPPGQRRVLCACETQRKRAIVAHPSPNAEKDVLVEDVICHGIGSVFCPRATRRRGYAARMMGEVARTLETWQVEATGRRSLFSILYSDIGKEFYAQHGWEPFDSSHVAVHPRGAGAAEPQGLPAPRKLRAADLAELCETDERLLRAQLRKHALRTSRPAVALLPDLQTMRWHHAREEYVAKELFGKEKVPEIKGAMVDAGERRRVWCYWTRNWYQAQEENTLHILRIVVERGGEGDEGDYVAHYQETRRNDDQSEDAEVDERVVKAIAALLQEARDQATEWGLARVEAWNPTPETIRAAKLLERDAKVVSRDKESIASLRWHGDHVGSVVDKVDWVGNEKYGWC